MCNRARPSHEHETLRTHSGADWLADRPMDNRFNPIGLGPRGRADVIRRDKRGVGLDINHDRWLSGDHESVVAVQRPYDAARMAARGPMSPTRAAGLPGHPL